MLNPDKQIVKSTGVDIPIMYVYLAGRIAGNCIDKCLLWRNKIVNHYADYKGRGAYPISFLDALNSKESDSVDKLGLTSAIPPNLIYDKDMMSVKKADVIVANMEDYMEAGLEDILKLEIESEICFSDENAMVYHQTITKEPDYEQAFKKLKEAILNRRPNYGTTMELSWALWLEKPTILIAGTEKRKEILERHPFTKRASIIVLDVDELLEKKWLNILYKSMSGATYE